MRGKSKLRLASAETLAFFAREDQRRSLELRSGVTVPLEGSVDDIRALVHKVWHDRLVHGAVPWDVSWLSHSVSVAHLVVLMEDWSLSGSPLSVSVWNWRVSWENSRKVPPPEVWVVQECPLVEPVVVGHEWSLVSETSCNSSGEKEDQVGPGNRASHIEILNGQFPDDCKTEHASHLSSRGVIGPVPIRLLSWSRQHFIELAAREP